MAKYRKRPVVVEAEPYRLGLEDTFHTIGQAVAHGWRLDGWESPENCDFKGIPVIQSLEGPMYISRGDWIITGVHGERYPCKPDIFEKTYEPAE